MALKDLTAPMVASENRLAWNPAPPSPSDGKQLVDSATLDGINKGINGAEYQKMAQEYAANEAALQQIQNQRLQSGLLGPTPQEQAMYQSELTNRYLTNLVGAKQAYQNAQVSQDEAGMANASLAGQQLREQGRAAGIDPALLSTDLTLDQARELQGQLEWQSVFNGMSADDYYQVQYNRYRDQGMGYTAAKRAAGADAAQYQAQQAARSSDAIFKYGLDGNGALNARGMQALMHMVQTGGDSGREMANIIANMLPGMKDAYSLNAQRALMGDKQGYQERNMALGHQYKVADKQLDFELDERKANNNVERAIAQAEGMLGVKAKGSQIEIQTRYLDGQKLGLEGNDLVMYALTGKVNAPKSNGAGGQDGQSAGGMKISDANTIINQYNKWNEEHDESEWPMNPYKDGYDKALEAMNGYSETPEDVNNSDSVYSWATSVLEQNAREGNKYTPEQLYKIIASVGGYGPQVAEEFKKDNKYKNYT